MPSAVGAYDGDTLLPSEGGWGCQSFRRKWTLVKQHADAVPSNSPILPSVSGLL